jgi:hypothetical protein
LDKTLLCGYCQEHKEQAELAETIKKERAEIAEKIEKEKMEELNQIIDIIDKYQMSEKDKSLVINFIKKK